MANLDSLDNIDFAKSDPKQMIKHFERFAALSLDAYRLASDFSLPAFYIKPKKIVLLGMGGSGAANDMLKSLLDESDDLIVESVHDYNLPSFVDRDTLVIASSYSGNTEETLAGFIAAYEKNAKLIAITTGGKLKILASKYKAPLLEFNYPCPPRGAFPYLFILVSQISVKLGHLKYDNEQFNSMVKLLESYLPKYSSSNSIFENPAKILAQKLYGKIPVIYATSKLYPVAERYKAEVNENSKNFAFSEKFPELNHKAIEGIFHPKGICYVLILESNFEYERNIIRQNVTAEILRNHSVPVERIKFMQAKDRVAEIMLFVMYGEFISYYLSILNKENSGINDMVDLLKEHLT